MASESDEHLIRYLLGELPDAEAEALDERSVTDDALALRLRVLEEDLIDRYARGERDDVRLGRFERARLASPHLREKVRFAEALQAVIDRSARAAPHRSSAPQARPLVWGLAAAAAVAIAFAGYLLLAQQRLRSELSGLEARQAAAEQQNAALQQQRAGTPPTSAAEAGQVTATFLLLPPRRGPGGPTVISVPQGAARVGFQLQVESADYERFWSALKEVSTGRVVWRSADVRSEPAGADRIVTVVLPAAVLGAQLYTIELSGAPAGGTFEALGEYSVRVVLN